MKPLLFIVLSLISSYSYATKNTYQEQEWGLAAMFRSAQIPFDTQIDTVSSFVPMMFYQGETFFMRGIEGGAHVYNQDNWELNLMGRMRFFDIPAEYQNAVQGDTIDAGVQWRNRYGTNTHLDLELFSDLDGRFYANLGNSWYIKHNSWELFPSVTARYKSADFNSQYFALSELSNETIGAGVELSAKLETRYHVISNLYLMGSFSATVLDKNAYQSQAVNERWNSEVYLGFAFFNDITAEKKKTLSNQAYVRFAHGWATPSNMGDIFRGDSEKDEYNNQLTSIFYGLPLTDTLFSLPIELYLTPGFVWHWRSEVQESEQEAVLAVKAYYTINWPVKWRIGAAEGLSYISDLTYIEQTEMDEKGYTGSKLLNYLDVSFDVNLGDVFNAKSMESVWLGYSLHHRSAIFERSSQFGRIKGGSNYNSVYLQFDF